MTSTAGDTGNDHLESDDVEQYREEEDDQETNTAPDTEQESHPNTPGIRTPHDLASEIVDLENELIGSQDITPDTDSQSWRRAEKSSDALALEVEESTLPPESGGETVLEADQSESSVDRGPSIQNSPQSTPDSSRPGSGLSIRSGQSPRRGPFERRFQARKPSASSIGLRNVSPAFLGSHSRHPSSSSQVSNASLDKEDEDDETHPWEVIKWTRLKKLSAQLFSETSKRAFGNRTFLVVGASIIVGTSKGLILVFDYQQNLKSIIGQGTAAAECGSITALAISADHSTVAGGHANGFIFTWELSNPSKPFLTISTVPRNEIVWREYDTHVENHAVIHIGFLGTRHTALVSADDSGMAFSHLATRGLGALSRTVKSTRILGRYPQQGQPASTASRKPSSVLAFASLPLGNVEQPTDDMGLTALLTPYLLVLVSTTPIAQTHYKAPRSKDIPAHGAMTGCLAWFPAVKLKTPASRRGAVVDTSLTKLAYCWSTVLTILEVDTEPKEEKDDDKRPTLRFRQARKWKSDEAIVAVQWISRSVLALLTITQRLVILEDNRMRVSDSCDLNPRHIYHRDVFSQQLEALVGNAEQEDTSMHGVIPDAYGMSFKAYKGRLFLLDASDVTLGTLSNWADRLGALMEVGKPLEAIELATAYYAGLTDKVTVGLPEDDETRKRLLHDKILVLIRDSVRYTFRMDETDELGKDIRTALGELIGPVIDACLATNETTFLFDEIYESYNEASCPDIFYYAIEPQIIDEKITQIPPAVLKDFVNWYYLMGLAPRLEAMICSLQTDTLDIDQVTSLCKEHFLYDALIYVWNHAVRDFVTPLKELLSLARSIPNIEEAAEHQSPAYEAATKMFPYLAMSLTGRRYPGGEEMPQVDADRARASIYGALFGGTELHAASAADRSAPPQVYSLLRGILHFDTPELMSAMNEAFEDAFLNGPEEHVVMNGDANGADEQLAAGWAINRQRVVKILLDILGSDEYADSGRLFLDMFLARNIPKFYHQKFILLEGSTLHKILLELCNFADASLADDCQLSVEYLLTIYKPPDLEKFIPLFEKAGFYRILKMTLKSSKQHARWLQVHFADAEDQSAVFEAIEFCFKPATGLSARQIKDIKSIVVDQAEHLAHLDIERTALVLASSATDLLGPVFDRLEGDTELQYRFLQTLTEQGSEREKAAAPSSAFISDYRARYVELMCQHEPNRVSDYISMLDASDLRLKEVLPVMEETGVIDAAVVLMAKEGLARDAVQRLVKHLATLQTAIAGLMDEKAANEDESLDGSLEDVASQVDKFAKLGVWLCQGISSRPPDGKQAARRLKIDDMVEENLTIAEKSWLDLITSVVDVCRAADLKAPAPALGSSNTQQPQDQSTTLETALRNTIQQCFTALLTATSTSQQQQQQQQQASTQPHPPPRLLPILRLFLTRLSTSAPAPATAAASASTPQNHTLHPILHSIFAAYAFESFLLTLSRQLLDRDVFAAVAAADAARRRGWRPSSRACAACGVRVWGVGAGGAVWDAWAERRRAVEQARSKDWRGDADDGGGKGKGRAVALPAGEGGAQRGADEGDDEGARDALVAFACGHVFHRRCLEMGMRARGRGIESDGRGRPLFVCLLEE